MSLYILSNLIIFSMVGVIAGSFWFAVLIRQKDQMMFHRRMARSVVVSRRPRVQAETHRKSAGGPPLAGGHRALTLIEG